ncbi:hypothetical protein Golob_004853 [Gossypium lobatum]|uniref:Uncharacterized protein n=1 Tax=Gossypium lobatum TaxID=34289 RepID=A0A7J8N346_9ROSI|nr:hypothetical protein [Gossypium lobatum]
MAALTPSPITVSLKLLIHSKSCSFLFAEAELRRCKAYLGIVVKNCEICILNGAPAMAANTVSLKLLVDSMSQRVLFAEAGKDFIDFVFNNLSFPVGTPTANKDTLLKPIASIKAAIVPPLLPTTESSKSIEIYRCRNTYHRSSCSLHVEGYVKWVITYMIMDDLVVRPMPSISCIALLNKFNIKDIGFLKRKPLMSE